MGGRAPVRIRRAAPGDVGALLALQQEAFGDDPFCLTRKGFEAFLTRRNVVVLAAEWKDAIVGYAVLHDRPFRPWTSLDYLAVTASRRRTGIGSALVEAAMPLVSRRTLRLLVRTSNEAAIGFYATHGFQTIALNRRHYSDGGDAYAMVRMKR